jgi:hypothetical protein
MRRTLLESLDKRSHNFIFFMLKRYYYPINPLCAMAAQGMKTILYVTKVTPLQLPINSNIATTRHKLQGMSKDILIVHSWNYKTQIGYMWSYQEYKLFQYMQGRRFDSYIQSASLLQFDLRMLRRIEMGRSYLAQRKAVISFSRWLIYQNTN